jgi:hypothetical protein
VRRERAAAHLCRFQQLDHATGNEAGERRLVHCLNRPVARFPYDREMGKRIEVPVDGE